ncbi:MAG: sulfotransferase family protein [Vicingaceae bacterium]
MSQTKRICLWSGPRNISTALMYSFGNRADTAVIDEPFYGYYLSRDHAKEYHPGAEEVMKSMECNGQQVIQNLLSNEEKPILFIKNMPHHIKGLELDFLSEMKHVLLLREPADMIRSFVKVIPNPTVKDFGYRDHLKLIVALNERGINFELINSKEILDQPEARLRKLCAALDIPFSNHMLKWKAGPRKEDGIWAQHWYSNVHKSVGFQPISTKTKGNAIPEKFKPILEELNELYQEITKRTLKQ